jgi:hypothetical protein
MRKINLQPPDNPEWQEWLDKCNQETEKLHELFNQGEKIVFNEKIYQQYKEFFFEAEKPPFYDKCAYCESLITATNYGDVEHFRPKAEITDEKNKKIFLVDHQGHQIMDQDGKPKKHPGYYWLAYDWQNLLISCGICNRPNKKNRFPVIGRHAQRPKDVIQEQILLINPVDEGSLSQQFRIDTATGWINGETDRGKMCIEVFGLNRDGLLKERKKACKLAKALVIDFFYNDDSSDIHKEAYKEIQEIQQGQHPYSFTQNSVITAAISTQQSKINKMKIAEQE